MAIGLINSLRFFAPQHRNATVLPALLLVALLQSTAASAEYQLLDRVVAIAEDDVVLASDVREEMFRLKRTMQARGAALPPDNVLYQQVMERAILDSLQLQRAYKLGLRIPDQELNDAMQRVAAQNRMSLPQFREALEQSGQSYLDTREQMRKEMLIRRIQQRGVMRSLNISDSEVENFLRSPAGAALLNPEYQIDHVLLPMSEQNSAAEREAARNAMQRLARAAADANSFAELDRQLAASGARHAPLGWRGSDDIPSLFEDVVGKLSTGEVSDIVESDSGLHLVKLVDKRGGVEGKLRETRVRHILIAPNEIRSEEQARELAKQVAEKLTAGEDFAKLAREYSDDPGSALRGGDLGWTGPGKMVASFEAVMDITDVEQTSPPFESPFGWHILQVMERRETDFSNQRAKEKARLAIAESKYEDELNNWLQQLRDDSFVEIK